MMTLSKQGLAGRIEAALMRGESIASIMDSMGVDRSAVVEARERLAEIAASPESLKKLAAGPLLNSLHQNKPNLPRRRVKKNNPLQGDMFPR